MGMHKHGRLGLTNARCTGTYPPPETSRGYQKLLKNRDYCISLTVNMQDLQIPDWLGPGMESCMGEPGVTGKIENIEHCVCRYYYRNTHSWRSVLQCRHGTLNSL